MDYDTLGDDRIGAVDLRIKRLVKDYSTSSGGLEWRQIYGAPISKSIIDLNVVG